MKLNMLKYPMGQYQMVKFLTYAMHAANRQEYLNSSECGSRSICRVFN